MTSTADDLEDLFENAPCGYLSLRPDGRIIKANQTLARWLDVPVDDLLEKRFRDLMNIAGRMFYETHFAPLLRMQGYFNEVAVDLVTANGKTLNMLANATERRGPDGSLLSTRVALFRATTRRRYERELEKARATIQRSLADERENAKVREEFIAVLGHDLRNPVAAIGNAIRILSREPQTDKSREVLGLTQGSLTRITGLIDNVLDLARGRLGGGIALSRSVNDLRSTLEQVIDELRSVHPARRIEALIDVPDSVNVDHGRIGQLLSNLLGNALTHGAPDEPIFVSATILNNILTVWVANSGPPIPPETMEHLFQPFFRGKVRDSQQGLGLGLYIAFEVARAHGGTLSAQSTETETRFIFTMPLKAAE